MMSLEIDPVGPKGEPADPGKEEPEEVKELAQKPEERESESEPRLQDVIKRDEKRLKKAERATARFLRH